MTTQHRGRSCSLRSTQHRGRSCTSIPRNGPAAAATTLLGAATPLCTVALLGAATLLLVAPAAAADDPLERTTRRGPVSATVRLAPSEPRLGDALTLDLEVVAAPEVELLMPVFGEALDRFRIVQFAPSEGIDDEGRTVATQRYTLQASRSGAQRIPPLLVEFVDRRPGRDPAPEGEDAYALLTEPLDFEVAGTLRDDAPLEVAAPLGALPPRTEPRGPLWPWLAGAAGLVAVASPFAWRALQRGLAARRRRSAYELARAELDALVLGARPRAPQEMDRFNVALSGIVRRYLEDHLGLRSPELTTEEFLDVMAASPELSRAHQQLLQRFLSLSDLVKFAHHVPEPADVEESIGAARRVLDETRGVARVAAEMPRATREAA